MSAVLNELIRDVAQSMPAEATPVEIAAAVIVKIGDDSERFLLELVTSAVYGVLTASRNQAMNRAGGPSKSPRVQQRRKWWDRFMSERVPVGDSQWKLIADCSKDDLEHVIAVREGQIAALAEQNAKYRKLIDAMDRFSAEKVSDLSPDLVDL